jgi:acetyl-CoA carboxylase biotin carboxyl carrier protein
MNIKEVKDLIQDILQSDISDFELEHTGTKVRLRRGFAPSDPAPVVAATAAGRPVNTNPEFHVTAPGVIPSPVLYKAEPAAEEGLHIITSPIVGTFYRSPSPGTESYVKIGAKVEVGTMLCIVEAMKLMNEIPSDVAGEVVEIYADNGHPVEYGQKLFGIKPRNA